MHYWLGQGPVGFYGEPQFPPLEPLVVVYPFVHLFPVFEGVELYMATVPALLVFPAYFLFRQSTLGRSLSLLGALTLACTAVYSQMADWNGGGNLLAIFFLMFALGFLVKSLRDGGIWNFLLSGLFVGLIAATHQFTLTLTAITFGLAFFMYVAFGAAPFWERLKRISFTMAYSGIFLIPSLPLYRYLLFQQANLGVGGYSSQLQAAYLIFPFYAWSGEGVQYSTIIVASVVFTLLGALTAAITRTASRDSSFFIVIVSLTAASLVMPPLEASSAERGLYYLAIPFVALTFFFFNHLLKSSQTIAVNYSRKPRRVHRLPSLAARFGPIGVIVLVLFFTAGTIEYSYGSMKAGARFYSELSPDSVAALNWISAQTPQTSVFFDDANLAAWILGYSQRAADSPTPLSYEATHRSLEIAEQSDLIEEGNYLSGDQFVTVGNNFPEGLGSPTVFIYTPGEWEGLFQSQGGLVYSTSGSELSVHNLIQAHLAREPLCTFTTESANCNYTLVWPQSDFSIIEHLDLSGQSADISWASTNGTLSGVNITWRAPPSGYVVNYLGFETLSRSLVLDHMATLSGNSFTLSAESSRMSQTVDLRTGWVTLTSNGTSLTWNFTGLLSSKQVPSSVDTSRLIGELGIDYFVVNEATHYTMFTRLQQGVYGPYSVAPVFDCGVLWIFELEAMPASPISVC